MYNMIDNQVKTKSLILIPIYNEQKHIFNVLRETFGNYLDNPETRLKYYQKIIDSEVKKC